MKLRNLPLYAIGAVVFLWTVIPIVWFMMKRLSGEHVQD